MTFLQSPAIFESLLEVWKCLDIVGGNVFQNAMKCPGKSLIFLKIDLKSTWVTMIQISEEHVLVCLVFVFAKKLSCHSVCIYNFLQALEEKAKSLTGVIQWPYRAVAKAVEIIPKSLIQNCGVNSIRTLTALRVSM